MVTVVNIPFGRGCEFVTLTIIGPQLKKMKRSLWHSLESKVAFNVV
jgi:hypothetical protein